MERLMVRLMVGSASNAAPRALLFACFFLLSAFLFLWWGDDNVTLIFAWTLMGSSYGLLAFVEYRDSGGRVSARALRVASFVGSSVALILIVGLMVSAFV